MSKFNLLSMVIFGLVFFYAEPSDNPSVGTEGNNEEAVVVEPKVVKNAIFEIQSATWCAPCRRFKSSGIIDELREQNWTIKFVDDIGKSYPTFRMWVNGKSVTWSGYSKKSLFYRTFNKNMRSITD